MFADPFRKNIDSPMAPAEVCFAIEPSDDGDLPHATKAIFVGEGGDLTLVPVRGDEEVTFRNLPSGGILDVRVRAIRTTGTTAGALVGLA